ncbi:Nn.00g059490.m01.CDS01 [Neocucurbitaria sp. VM-36]
MRCFNLCPFVTVAAGCTRGSISDPLESPFGLTFTPTTVIASRFNASGSVELTKWRLGTEYQKYYQDAASNFDPQERETYDLKNSTIALFQEAATPITESLSKRLGKKPEYAAIFVPSVFSYVDRDAAANAVLGKYLGRAVRPGMSQQATCPGFGFLDCRNLGREPEECVDEGPPSLIVVLEYEKEYLYVWLMEVVFDLGTYVSIHKVLCKECGERTRDDIGTQAYREQMSLFLNYFIDKALQKRRFDWGQRFEPQRDSIRSIVLSGEASPNRTAELGEMMRDVVGTQTVQAMTEIDASEVVAYGVAVWARLTQEIPDAFMVCGDTGNLEDSSREKLEWGEGEMYIRGLLEG